MGCDGLEGTRLHQCRVWRGELRYRGTVPCTSLRSVPASSWVQDPHREREPRGPAAAQNTLYVRVRQGVWSVR